MPRIPKPKTTIEKRIYHVEFDMEVIVSTDPGVKQLPVEEMVAWQLTPERLVKFMRNSTHLAATNYRITMRARKPTYTTRLVRTFKKKVPYVEKTLEEGEE
jgi:hypothetical protein